MGSTGSGIDKLFEAYGEVLDAEEVATVLRLAPQTVRRELRSGELPGIRVGPPSGRAHYWRVLKSDLIDYLKARHNQQSAPAAAIDTAGDGRKVTTD